MSSWKEIATFFDRDVRTVRRWESARMLPVHRVPGGGRSGVFAYVHELEEWLARARDENVDLEGPLLSVAAPDEAAVETLDLDEVPEPVALEAAAEPVVMLPGAVVAPRRFPLVNFMVPLTIAFAAIALFAVRQSHRAPAQYVPAPVSASSAPPSTSAEAQELYLRGLYLWNQRTESSLTSAVDLFTQAIVHDPHFAAAYVGLADSYILLRQYGKMPDGEAFPRALAASRQALALDDASPDAHRTYGFLLNFWMWNFPESEREFKRAIELRPADALSHHWYATTLYSASRFEDAMREIDIARRLQPDSITIMANRGLLLGRIDPAASLAFLLEVEKVNPSFPAVHRYLADAYANQNNFKGYLEETRKRALLRNDDEGVAALAEAERVLASQGSKAMLEMMARTSARRVDAGHPDAMVPAFYYAKLGDRQHTLEYMQVALTRHEANFLIIHEDPTFRPMWDMPEYKNLLKLRETPMTLDAALHFRPSTAAGSVTAH